MEEAVKKVVFGDVHGQDLLLQALFKECRDRYGACEFYTVGDLIDRGPGSKQVLDLCIEHGVRGIYGNHELWMRNFADYGLVDPYALSAIMGGAATIDSYNVDDHGDIEEGLRKAVPDSHRKFLKSLQMYMRLDVGGTSYWLIHGGIKKEDASRYEEQGASVEDIVKSVCGFHRNSCLWTGFNRRRNNIWHMPPGHKQIMGHSPLSFPIVSDSLIAIDTGCGTCSPFTLSAIVLPDEDIIQIPPQLF